MAISVFHNPSDNKLRGRFHMLVRQLPQPIRLAGRAGADLGGSLCRPFLCLTQEVFALRCRICAHLLQERKASPLRIGDDLSRLSFRGQPPLLAFLLHFCDFFDCFQGHLYLTFSPAL